MPLMYNVMTSLTAGNAGFPTNGTPNVESYHISMKPGPRTLYATRLTVGGKCTELTALSGIALRLKKWTATPSGLIVVIIPTPLDTGTQACGAAVGGPNPASIGTGGPQYLGGCVCNAGGPGGWAARDLSMAPALEGSVNQSIDLVSSSALANTRFDVVMGIQE